MTAKSLTKIRIMEWLEGVADEIERISEGEFAGTFADWAEVESYSNEHFDERWAKMKEAGFGPVELLYVLGAAARAGDVRVNVEGENFDPVDLDMADAICEGNELSVYGPIILKIIAKE